MNIFGMNPGDFRAWIAIASWVVFPIFVPIVVLVVATMASRRRTSEGKEPLSFWVFFLAAWGAFGLGIMLAFGTCFAAIAI